jgi:hypothetical protein
VLSVRYTSYLAFVSCFFLLKRIMNPNRIESTFIV